MIRSATCYWGCVVWIPRPALWCFLLKTWHKKLAFEVLVSAATEDVSTRIV
jgi:hypothetical protein